MNIPHRSSVPVIVAQRRTDCKGSASHATFAIDDGGSVVENVRMPAFRFSLWRTTMLRRIVLSILALTLSIVTIAPSSAANKAAAIQANGMYLEARTCDVWTGPCFANADFNIGGKQGVMAWRIEKGQAGDVSLDGLSVVAVVSAANTIRLEQRAPATPVLIVDRRAHLKCLSPHA